VQYLQTKILMHLETDKHPRMAGRIKHDGFRKPYSRAGMIQSESLLTAKPSAIGTSRRSAALPVARIAYPGDAHGQKREELEDLFHETLKDIYYAEKKILTALPKMAKAAQSEDLQAAFEKHVGETTDQVERLEQIFELIKHPAKGKTCDAINGTIDESQQVMKEFKRCAALDAGLIASAQAVEHYEISRYGTLKAWAQQLGLQQAVTLLDETLEEEKKTDEALTELAKAAVNQEAQQAAE
jgi:ferritin-like metal-binding protein YciE